MIRGEEAKKRYALAMGRRWWTVVLIFILGGLAGVLWWVWPISWGFVEHRVSNLPGERWKMGTRGEMAPAGTKVSIETRLIQVGSNAFSRTMEGIGLRRAMLPDEGGPPIRLEDTQVDRLIRIVQATANSTSFGLPRMDAVENHPTRCAVTSQQAYVLNLVMAQPVTLPFDPEVATAESGVSFMVTPILSRGSSRIRLRMRIVASQLNALYSIPYPESPPGSNDQVQRPQRTTMATDLDFEAENGGWSLLPWRDVSIAGGSGIPMDPAGPTAPRQVRFLVLVKATVHSSQAGPKSRPAGRR